MIDCLIECDDQLIVVIEMIDWLIIYDVDDNVDDEYVIQTDRQTDRQRCSWRLLTCKERAEDDSTAASG